MFYIWNGLFLFRTESIPVSLRCRLQCSCFFYTALLKILTVIKSVSRFIRLQALKYNAYTCSGWFLETYIKITPSLRPLIRFNIPCHLKKCIYKPPPSISLIRGYCFLRCMSGCLPVCMSVQLSVCRWFVSNFNVGHNFWTFRPRDFIFGIHGYLTELHNLVWLRSISPFKVKGQHIFKAALGSISCFSKTPPFLIHEFSEYIVSYNFNIKCYVKNTSKCFP